MHRDYCRLWVRFLVAASHTGGSLGREETTAAVFTATVTFLSAANSTAHAVQHAGDDQ